jgi:hypothetical protein
MARSLSSGNVVRLAGLPKTEREKTLAEDRLRSKDFACTAVKCYMEALHVSIDDLSAFLRSGASTAPPGRKALRKPAGAAFARPVATPPEAGSRILAARRRG